MRDTTIAIQRPAEGPTIQSGILVQVDQMSDRELHAATQVYDFHGYDGYKISTIDWQVTQIQRGDTLIDERFLNEDTGAYFKYRVVSRPKTFPNDHQEMICEVVGPA